MPYRGMAIDAGAASEEEIQRMSNHYMMYDEYIATAYVQENHDLLGEMRFRGVRIHCLPPVIEETPDTTA